MPEAIALLLEKVTKIEKIICGAYAADESLKPMLTINEAAEYMGLSKSSMYKLTHLRQLPVYKP